MNSEDKDRSTDDERSPQLKGDLEAQPDELGTDPSEVGPKSAGQNREFTRVVAGSPSDRRLLRRPVRYGPGR